MPNRHYLQFIFFILFIAFGNTAVLAEPTIWFQPDFPPYAITKGADKKFGIDNRIIEYVSEHLSMNASSFKTANYGRILEELKKGTHGIITPLFKTTAREKFVRYTSRPSYFVFSNGIIFNRTDKKKYSPFLLKDGTIDLEALCKSKRFRIGISSGRSYSGVIDKIIQKYNYGRTFTIRLSSDHLGVLKMLKRKRVDAAFGFPVEIKYARLNKELVFCKVADMPPITPVYFGAPQNKFGYSMVRKINKLLEQTNATDIFASYYTYWLDEELIEEYYKLRREYKFSTN
ncbi:transporter substrate-binding domain-containing protein [Desulfovibrio sp. JC022]|uniref:transporter substrate-binding domain-containing protein n=1 Tax=Desulfovibrio sp. JC022 TaxID=2593642 RepID=UPI0013D3EBEB|nr:transporter substrate-binding domain-containing protein [Desulfovibrio sp. JC022]NDV23903.1 transporter substrate-binding domain-containing protein [Desulfovibrio sp. JC022]